MIIKNHNKIIVILILLIFCTSVANAELLFTAKTDKQELSLNEVAFIEITVYNDSTEESQEAFIRLEGSEGIIFLENEERIIGKKISPINSQEKSIIKIKFKANYIKNEDGTIFVYSGKDFAFGVPITLKNKPIFVESKATQKITGEGEKIIIEYTFSNQSQEELTNVGFGTIVPLKFEVKTEPKLYDTINPGESINGTIEIIPPLGLKGEQKIIFNYGYFDFNGTHYFEKSFNINYSQDNRVMLGLIGLFVLAVAIILFWIKHKKKDDKKVKGTADKEK